MNNDRRENREKKRQRTPRETKSALTSAQIEKYERQKMTI